MMTQRLRLARPIVAFDLETTGLDIAGDRIVEICLVKLHVDGRREIITRRLNPGRPIAPQATAVHGITDADIAAAPRFEEAARALYDMFAGCDLTGFNIEHFDLPLLANEFGRVGLSFPAPDVRVIDSFRIFTMREPRDLSAALRFYCKREMTDAHQAEADALAAADVLLAQVDRYSDLPCDVAGLHMVCRPPEWLDGQGKIVWSEHEAVISFGKHKGKSLRWLAENDASYLQWICRGNFAPDTIELVKQALRGVYPIRELVASIDAMVEEVMLDGSGDSSAIEAASPGIAADTAPAVADEPVAIDLREAAVNGLPKAAAKSDSQLALFGRAAG